MVIVAIERAYPIGDRTGCPVAQHGMGIEHQGAARRGNVGERGRYQPLAALEVTAPDSHPLLQAGRDLLARGWLTDSRAGALNVHRLARSARSSRPSPTTAAQPAAIAGMAAALGSALPARNGFSTNRHRSWAAMRTPIRIPTCSTPFSGRATHMRQKTMTGQCRKIDRIR